MRVCVSFSWVSVRCTLICCCATGEMGFPGRAGSSPQTPSSQAANKPHTNIQVK